MSFRTVRSGAYQDWNDSVQAMLAQDLRQEGHWTHWMKMDWIKHVRNVSANACERLHQKSLKSQKPNVT